MKLRIYSYNAKTLLYESPDIKKLLYVNRYDSSSSLELHTSPLGNIRATWEHQIPTNSSYSGLATTAYSNTTIPNLTRFDTENDVDLYEIYTPEYSSLTGIAIKTYINTAEPHRVNKLEYLKSDRQYIVVMRDECSLTNPTIILESTQQPTFNYVQIPKFNRYYYVDNIININNNLWEIYLKVDVLYSYMAQIRGLSAFIDRNEFDYNKNIINKDVVIEQGCDVYTSRVVNHLFSNHFGHWDDSDPISDSFVVTGVAISSGRATIPRITASQNFNWLSAARLDNMQTTTVYNNKIVLDKTELHKLMLKLLDVNLSEIFYGEDTDFITSIVRYPFFVPHIDFDGYLDRRKHHIFIRDTEYPVDSEQLFDTGYFNMGQYKPIVRFNGFADFSGYTTITVYLPYLGYVSINPNDVFYIRPDGSVGSRYIQFRLQIEYTSGKGLYIIATSDDLIELPKIPMDSATSSSTIIFPRTSSDEEKITRILGTYECQIGEHIPVGRTNQTELMANLIRGGVKGIANLATSYLMDSYSPGTISKSNSKQTLREYSGRKISGKVTLETNRNSVTTTPYINTQKAMSSTMQTAVDSLFLSGQHASSDRVDNFGLFMSTTQDIWVVTKTPKLKELTPEYYHLYGAPLGETKKLKECEGFTKISEVQLEGIPALADELDEIEKLLYEGIIL